MLRVGLDWKPRLMTKGTEIRRNAQQIRMKVSESHW